MQVTTSVIMNSNYEQQTDQERTNGSDCKPGEASWIYLSR